MTKPKWRRTEDVQGKGELFTITEHIYIDGLSKNGQDTIRRVEDTPVVRSSDALPTDNLG